MLKENCSVCFKPITTPICESCYMRQIEKWLEHIDMTALPKKFILDQIKRNLYFDGINEGECIICGSEVNVCSYCFFLKVASILKKIKLSDEFIQDFLATFNYAIKH
ncbi:MAG: hypothetical protein ACOYT4_05495 [Nanoarchaeota archaeon]